MGIGATKTITIPQALLNGDTYKIVAGILRNTGTGWGLLTNSEHDSINVDSVSNDATQITIDYTTLGVSKVISFAVTPDETYAGDYEVGASVGLSETNIQISQYFNQTEASLLRHTGTGTFTSNSAVVLSLIHISEPTRPY